MSQHRSSPVSAPTSPSSPDPEPASHRETGSHVEDTVPGPLLAERRSRLHRRRVVRLSAVTFAVAALVGLTVVYGRLSSRQATMAAASPLLGKPAPAFALRALDGQPITSRSLEGNVLVVNFWASWCVACREEATNLESFYTRWSGTGLHLVGIVYADSASDARAFDTEYKITFPSVMDPGGATALDYGVTGVPETFVISPSGTVVAHLVGAVGPTTLDSVLTQLSGGSRPIERQGPGFRQAPSGR